MALGIEHVDVAGLADLGRKDLLAEAHDTLLPHGDAEQADEAFLCIVERLVGGVAPVLVDEYATDVALAGEGRGDHRVGRAVGEFGGDKGAEHPLAIECDVGGHAHHLALLIDALHERAPAAELPRDIVDKRSRDLGIGVLAGPAAADEQPWENNRCGLAGHRPRDSLGPEARATETGQSALGHVDIVLQHLREQLLLGRAHGHRALCEVVEVVGGEHAALVDRHGSHPGVLALDDPGNDEQRCHGERDASHQHAGFERKACAGFHGEREVVCSRA